LTYEDLNHLAGSVESLATALALLVGGYWTYNRFLRQRDDFAFIEFTVEINVIGAHGDSSIVELVANLENKGKVQHQVRDLSFELDGIKQLEALEVNSKFGGQAYFPHSIASGAWVPPATYFIEPGLTNRYSYVARVPNDVAYLMLHGRFTYLNQKASHSAEATVPLNPL
jgi:hypothetical protein